MDAFRELVPIGTVVKTSYNTGPYRVERIFGPSTEPSYGDYLNLGSKADQSRPHYSMSCVYPTDPPGTKPHSFLNGYELRDGRILSVWNESEIFIVGQAAGQLSLF